MAVITNAARVNWLACWINLIAVDCGAPVPGSTWPSSWRRPGTRSLSNCLTRTINMITCLSSPKLLLCFKMFNNVRDYLYVHRFFFILCIIIDNFESTFVVWWHQLFGWSECADYYNEKIKYLVSFFLRRPQLRLHIVKGPVKGFIAHVGEGGHVGLEKAF